MIVADRIKEVRKKLQMTQKEFAKSLKTPHTTISKYEKGLIKPSFDILSNIGKIYKVNLNWLLTGKGEMFLQKYEQEKIKRELKTAIRIIKRAIPFAEDLACLNDEYIQNETSSFLYEVELFLQRNK